MTVRSEKREFTKEFKFQMIKLYSSGKPKADIRTKVIVILQKCSQILNQLDKNISKVYNDGVESENNEVISLLY